MLSKHASCITGISKLGGFFKHQAYTHARFVMAPKPVFDSEPQPHDIPGFGQHTLQRRLLLSAGPDAKMIPFRLDSDLTLVSYKKTVMGVCELLHQAVTRHGIGEVAITDHVLEGKVTSGAA